MSGKLNLQLYSSGQKHWQQIKEFGELIYNHATDDFYNFVVYFSKQNQITLEYIDTKEKYSYKVNPNDFNALVPEHVLNAVFIKNNILYLQYQIGEVKINLKNKRRIM